MPVDYSKWDRIGDSDSDNEGCAKKTSAARRGQPPVRKLAERGVESAADAYEKATDPEKDVDDEEELRSHVSPDSGPRRPVPGQFSRTGQFFWSRQESYSRVTPGSPTEVPLV